MALYVCQLHAGHWYISAETNSPKSLAMLTYQKPYDRPFDTEAKARQAARDCMAHHCALTVNAPTYQKIVRLMEGVSIIGHIAYFVTDSGLRGLAQSQLIQNDAGMFGVVIISGKVASTEEAESILARTSFPQDNQ